MHYHDCIAMSCLGKSYEGEGVRPLVRQLIGPLSTFKNPVFRNKYGVKQTLSVLLKPSLKHKIIGLLAVRNFNWNEHRQTWVCV